MAYFQFYYPKRLSFCPDDYECPGLGGGEASIVLLTTALAKRGHKVEVFNAVWKPKNYNGVTWKGAWEINDAPAPDVFVAIRLKSAILDNKARRNLFWMLDDRTAGAAAFSDLYPDGSVVLASDAMIGRLQMVNFNGRISKIPLPIEINKYDDTSAPSSSCICIHTSMPNRGLVELLKFWPDIRKQVPYAELYITSGWELWGYTEEEARDRFNQTLGSNFKNDGVFFTGVLSRSDLISLQRKSRLGLFPSFFPEMFCLAAAEMAVAGRPIIVSELDALAERVVNQKTGFVVSGDIKSKEVHDLFVRKTVELLKNDTLADEMGENAKHVREYVSSESVAKQWELLVLD